MAEYLHARTFIHCVRNAGNMAVFAEKYNYVCNDSYAIGSASQDYITNTHMKWVIRPCAHQYVGKSQSCMV